MTHIVSLTRNQIVVGAAVAAVALAVGLAIGFSVWRIRTKGRIFTVGVKVYSNSELTTELHEIDWGIMYPNQSKYVICYIKNIKTSNITLTLLTENWQPNEAARYLGMSWSISASLVLQPNESTAATLILSVSEAVTNITDFSFDIIIRATAVEP